METTQDETLKMGLADIRRRRLAVWIVLVAYLPTVVSLLLLLREIGVDDHRAAPFIAIPYLAIFGITVTRVGRARCPRCHERFHSRRLYSNPWIKACLHCGLRLDGEQQ